MSLITHYIFIIYLVITATWAPAKGMHDVVKALRSRLLLNYNRHVRPVIDRTRATIVAAKMHIFHVEKLNEKEQSVKIHGIFQMSWTDEYLKWDPTQYNDTKFILFRSYEIWTPAITLANTARQSSLDYYWNLPVKVWYAGIVYASPEFTFDVSCLFDFTDYPYDEQTCSMGFFASGLSTSDINWTKIIDPELRTYWPASEKKVQVAKWKITNTSSALKFWNTGGLSNQAPNKSHPAWSLPIIEMSVSFKRNDIYFGSTVVLPAVLTSLITISATVPFVRIKPALLLLLLNFIIQSFYADNLLDVLPPSLGSLPRIVAYYAFNFCATTFAILFRVALLYMQIRKAQRVRDEKKAAEEASNQERLPQVAPIRATRFGFLMPFLEPEKLSCVLFTIYVVAYAICAVVNL